MRRPAARHSEAAPRPPKHLSLFAAMAANNRTAWADGGGPWPPSGRLPLAVANPAPQRSAEPSERRSRKAAISGAATLT